MEQQRLVLVLCLSALVVHGGVVPKVKTMPVSPNATVVPAPRIVGGTRASAGDFPYQAALYIDGAMFCGGSLISEDYVLTAGHCVDGGSHWIIYLGTVDLTMSENGRQIAQSVDATPHERYDSATLANDVALLHLRAAVVFTSSVGAVNLAAASAGDFLYAAATVSGWGVTSDGSSLISAVLYFTDLTVIGNAECSGIYGNVVQDWTLCARSSRSSNPCNGDSGGALVTSDRKLQIGVTSFVARQGCTTQPAGYARVSYFRDWIRARSGV